jgi:drug/metabolite transporter (DMT)-like permease
LISHSYRLCEAALVAPFEYIAMPMAVIWGVLIFGEWPNLQVWFGSGLIVAAGLLSLWRETRRAQALTRPHPRNTG